MIVRSDQEDQFIGEHACNDLLHNVASKSGLAHISKFKWQLTVSTFSGFPSHDQSACQQRSTPFVIDTEDISLQFKQIQLVLIGTCMSRHIVILVCARVSLPFQGFPFSDGIRLFSPVFRAESRQIGPSLYHPENGNVSPLAQLNLTIPLYFFCLYSSSSTSVSTMLC